MGLCYMYIRYFWGEEGGGAYQELASLSPDLRALQPNTSI